MKLLKSHLLPILLIASSIFIPTAILAQTSSSTVAVSIDDLLLQGRGVVDAFQTVGVLAGVTAAIMLLVNLTKLGPIDAFIFEHNLKWVRPILAIVAGVLGGVGAALAKGLPWYTALLYAVGGLMSGGGAIAVHEVLAAFNGERKR